MKLPLVANQGPDFAWLEDAEFSHIADYLLIENAQTIAHRVNCFEELRDALAELESWAHSVKGMMVNGSTVENGQIFIQARAALERAKT